MRYKDRICTAFCRKYSKRELAAKHGIRKVRETHMTIARRLNIKISDLKGF
jgi:hypothetical protein